jgi:hypothetical protein
MKTMMMIMIIILAEIAQPEKWLLWTGWLDFLFWHEQEIISPLPLIRLAVGPSQDSIWWTLSTGGASVDPLCYNQAPEWVERYFHAQTR